MEECSPRLYIQKNTMSLAVEFFTQADTGDV
jgi:hypothetical protein